eukprot:CAMPEP_0115855316 /NCGR_PEP_ID=MMETSP0287-20121206/14479_1 /TAXON_ID=412157 /ORGANISM="Chrysochromulina rotalis, Strain UIO044" /LENGTH=234 /DNA_ID=CAMNT_0003309465 /DNA_START=257 /DNA_END=961 /DNA_ORIENTATION=+
MSVKNSFTCAVEQKDERGPPQGQGAINSRAMHGAEHQSGSSSPATADDPVLARGQDSACECTSNHSYRLEHKPRADLSDVLRTIDTNAHAKHTHPHTIIEPREAKRVHNAIYGHATGGGCPSWHTKGTCEERLEHTHLCTGLERLVKAQQAARSALAPHVKPQLGDRVHIEHAKHSRWAIWASRCPQIQPARVTSIKQQRIAAIRVLTLSHDALEAVVLDAELASRARMWHEPK